MAIAIPPNLPQQGDVVAGKYRLEEVLGVGGVGIVVAARHAVLGQRVAIKFLLHPAAQAPEDAERLLREARAISMIKSDHVARVLDVDRLPSGAPFMVMEYLAGTDLGRLRRARGRLPPSDAVDAVLQACEPLAEAHAMGIVHRDLKPQNLFVVARPDRSLSIKVIDFGIAKIERDRGGRLTAMGVVAGSPQYMAPEQMQSLKLVDHRADIWSLGVILYYLMSGRRPYEGSSIGAVWAAMLTTPAPPLRSLCPAVPPGLEAVVMRCLERNPAQRVQDLVELSRGIAPFGSERGRRSVDWVLHALGNASA
ncbi:Serine/threonine-protein kinase pkn3 [Minicystis rosea]|nr:Serine/threonine-protein kinase pkn3 [Minicystis rosea]